MFNRKKKNSVENTSTPSGVSDLVNPKYAKPKILLIDLPSSCSDVLKSAGYNVSSGTFGIPYSVARSNKLWVVSDQSYRLPNVEEQEIVIVSTACPHPRSNEKVDVADGVDVFWQCAKQGQIDPRPLAMMQARKHFEKIRKYGGIFIVLLSAKYFIEYLQGSSISGRFIKKYGLLESNWAFLEELDSFECTSASGTEINFNSDIANFASLLKRGMQGAQYHCELQPSDCNKANWTPLALNKHSGCVAGLLVHKDPPWHLLLLPDMPRLDVILPDLITEWCTRWNPALFPLHEGGRWIHRPEYEVPKVIELQEQATRISENAKRQVEKLEAEIRQIQEQSKDWYTLLNGTGDELVLSVIRSFQKLGFEKVKNVDVDERAKGNGNDLREDIQIQDRLPILIVDVKGIQGHPADAEVTQAEKHALMRAKEFRGDVKPLTIINHQRNLPPHDRDIRAYRQEIIENAKQTNLGLMTTWDLFCLLRNKEKLGWDAKDVIPIFYRSGRIEPIPEHYQYIGVVARIWKGIFGIVPEKDISLGDRLAIEFNNTFDEVVVESLQVDDKSIDRAPVGSNCGIKYRGDSDKVCENKRVWLVSRA